MATLGYILTVSVIFFGDLYIKNRTEQKKDFPQPESLSPENSPCRRDNVQKPLWSNYILLRKYHNTGAMLNLGARQSRRVAALSVLLCIVMTCAFVLSLGHRGNRTLRTGLSLLLGGSFSNTYDRLKRKYVVDYFSFNVKWKSLRRIVFNLSDFCIIGGALLTALGAAW